MSQFDVHRNPGQNAQAIPYVVVVQSSLFAAYRRRVVVPLVDRSYLGEIAIERFNPTFEIEETTVVLHPLEIVSVEFKRLGDVVTSLADDGQKIMDAVDLLITMAHG